MKVLVIDDDTMTQLLIQKSLYPHGLELIEAQDGVTGVRMAVEQSPELMLLDIICRQGGDEFIIVLTELKDHDAAMQISQKILQQLNEPFDIDGTQITTSLSIGISIYPEDDISFDGLLSKADTAMYAAKKQGRNTLRFFSRDMSIAPKH